MTLLQIDKKAVTDEDAKYLMNKTMLIQSPLGVPTIYFQTEEFDAAQNMKDILRVINTRLQEFSASPEFNWLHPSQKDRLFSADADMAYARTLLRYTRKKAVMPECRPVTHSQFQEFADQYSRRDYKQPLYNIILVGNSVEQDFMPSSGITHTPKAQLHLFALWHEIAHGTGAGEPQSDMIAGCVTAQAFSDLNVIKWQADKRAFEAINFYNNPYHKKNFGWAAVDANDFMSFQNPDRIAKLSEEQIKNLRFVRFQKLSDTVTLVAQAIAAKVKALKEKGDQISYLAIADQLGKNEFKDNPTASYMAQRFALANYRLSGNPDIYKKALGVLPPDGKYPTLIDELVFPPAP